MELQQQNFDFHGHAVRVLGTEENPMFVLNDVAKALGIKNIGVLVGRLDKADICRTDVRSERQVRNMVTVNESALYEVVLRSDKPEARRFSRWVTHEVLPTIRKHGAYLTEQRAMEMGLFRIKETTVVHSDGHTSISKTPKVTGKGQQYFVSRFLDGRFAA
ncbi:BRO family protein [uncultured Corynebacterium sp.]|uniref:phage antirepressor n=1 Tax=uncultured Corynebacterium sp. TaxID=159447 RepID=UPI00263165E7|nr:BRO family protein [uncultured Corynebacterium sp.]